MTTNSFYFGGNHVILFGFILDPALERELVAQLRLRLGFLHGHHVVFVGDGCLNHGLLVLLSFEALTNLVVQHLILQLHLQLEILSCLINVRLFA